MSAGRERLLAQFRDLVTERLGRINKALLSLEAGPDADAGKRALRDLHGLKGEARMMGFGPINDLVHEMEEIVRAAEPRGCALAAGSVDALLVVSDAIAVLAGAAAGEPPDVPKLLAWLKQAVAAEKTLGSGAAPSPSAPPSPAPSAPPSPAPQAAPPPPVERVPSNATPPPVTARNDARIRITQQSLETLTSAVTTLQQRARQRETLESRRRQLARELVALHRLAEDLGPLGAELAARLGRSKELTSELNRRSSLLGADEVRDLTVISEEITALRMVPLGMLFEPYPRMVRELGRELGKDIELHLDGAEERMDRTVLGALRDPLLHLVRNAIDHGLETPVDRAAQGKGARGTLQIHGRREGERLVIRVADDGRGMTPSLLREVAVRKALMAREQAEALSDLAALELVFLPGFSSREAVTDVSGRGVGLDVVRSAVVSIGGEVTVESRPGEGTSFELRVPISLTVAPVLFVQVGDERLCVPASSVERAFTVATPQVREVAGKPALAVDDEVLPYSSIASILFAAPEKPPGEGELVLVIRGRGRSAALSVDRVLEERVQAVLPLNGLLTQYAHVTGATPLSDGELALVVSAPHLVATAHGTGHRLGAQATERKERQRRKVLVVDDSPLTRELLVSLLEAVGYLVVQSVDGARALELLARESVDIVVTDLEMPNVDGLELTRRLKGSSQWRSLPVVIVTTRGNELDRRRGMEAGADGYVTKGDLVRQDLVDVVARLLA